MEPHPEVIVRPARARDVAEIRRVVEPLVRDRVLVAKASVTYYESVQETLVAEVDGRVVGCGALHVMWEDLAEVRTLAVDADCTGRGIGGRLLDGLLDRARKVGVERVYCLTFEADFFVRHGFIEIEGTPVGPDIYAELLRSYDEGVAGFLDLDRVKPNTLGNRRMLRTLTPVEADDVVIAESDPDWPRHFATERQILRGLVPAATIEHIGSTAIDGMPAKPVIDVLLGVPAEADITEAVQRLALHGYIVEGEHSGHAWLWRPSPTSRASVVHVVRLGGRQWVGRLAFRDRLREDPVIAAEYAGLKRDLAARRLDPSAYTSAKRALIDRVLDGAG